MSKDIAVTIKNVTKDFKLPHHKSSSIKDSIVHVFQKKDKTVETFHALRGISFDIHKGDFFGVLGRNGSGKSTLLKIISEIYQPTTGSVTHTGKLVSFIELGVGFKPELTGRENVYLNSALLGFSRKEIDEMYNEIITFAELEKFEDQKLKNYSSGMKVRLAFSVAIQAKADILVLDEVLAVGDADFQRKCYEYFTSLKKQEKTIIFVSHSMGAVKQYCNKAVLIENGKIAFSGTAEDTANEYLKLFNRSRYDKEQRKAQDRFGSGEIEISKVSSKISDEEYTIDLHLKANEDVSDIVIGTDILDSNGKIAGGVDNKIQRENKFAMKKGDVVKFTYTYKNIFGGGGYTVTIGIRSSDSTHIYDFWRKATEFTNITDASTYFPIVLPVKISKK